MAGHRLSHRASYEAWILEQLHHPRRYLFHRVHQEPAHHPGFDVGYRLLLQRRLALPRPERAKRNAEGVLGRRPVKRPAPSRIHRLSYRLAECHYEASVREHGALCLLRGRCGMVYSIDTHSLDPVHHRRGKQVSGPDRSGHACRVRLRALMPNGVSSQPTGGSE